MPIVIADASPLFYLAAIGRLDYCRALYGELLVPETAWAEALAGDKAIPGIREVWERANFAGWIVVLPPPAPLPDERLRVLDPGERDALALALACDAPLILLDDLKARHLAKALGIRMTGTVGVLLEAKRSGLLPALRPDLERLLRETSFRMNEDLRQLALRKAGENE
jgi:uncharacterized protein